MLISALIGLAFLFLVVSSVPAISGQPGNSGHNVTDAVTHTSSRVLIYSTYPGSPQYEIYVPLNSSGFAVYPIWHIFLYGNGNFRLTVNNTVVESGVVVNSIHIKYDWTQGKDNRTTAILNFDNTNYSFNDILSGPLNDQVIQSVTITSVLKGQNQVLAAESNVSGDLMFPTWTVAFHSTQRLNYSIYVKGKLVESGSVIGNKNVSFNVSGSSVSVQVILGTKTYSYPNELISSVPIEKYYGPKPPSNTATFLDEVFAAVKGVFGIFPAMVLSYIGVKPLVIARKERTPVVW